MCMKVKKASYDQEVETARANAELAFKLQVYSTLQMKGRWKSYINVWLRFMYYQKWNCAALLFLSPNFHTHVSVSYLDIPRICLPILQQKNSHTDPRNI